MRPAVFLFPPHGRPSRGPAWSAGRLRRVATLSEVRLSAGGTGAGTVAHCFAPPGCSSVQSLTESRFSRWFPHWRGRVPTSDRLLLARVRPPPSGRRLASPSGAEPSRARPSRAGAVPYLS